MKVLLVAASESTTVTPIINKMELLRPDIEVKFWRPVKRGIPELVDDFAPLKEAEIIVVLPDSSRGGSAVNIVAIVTGMAKILGKPTYLFGTGLRVLDFLVTKAYGSGSLHFVIEMICLIIDEYDRTGSFMQ
jgi:hypothetical protein